MVNNFYVTLASDLPAVLEDFYLGVFGCFCFDLGAVLESYGDNSVAGGFDLYASAMKGVNLGDIEAVIGCRHNNGVARYDVLFIVCWPGAHAVNENPEVRSYVVKLGRQSIAGEVVKGGEVQPLNE